MNNELLTTACWLLLLLSISLTFNFYLLGKVSKLKSFIEFVKNESYDRDRIMPVQDYCALYRLLMGKEIG